MNRQRETALTCSHHKKFCALWIIAAVVLLWSTPSSALNIFTDRLTWETAVGAPIITETFDNDITNATMITFDTGVVSVGAGGVEINRVVGNWYEGSIDTDQSEGSDNFFRSITWSFPMPILAFGADWFQATDAEGLTVTGNFDGTGDVTINFFSYLDSQGNGFLGVIGLSPFSTIVFESGGIPSEDWLNENFNADNLSFQTVAESVPEPTTMLLLGSGLLGLAGLRRKFRK